MRVRLQIISLTRMCACVQIISDNIRYKSQNCERYRIVWISHSSGGNTTFVIQHVFLVLSAIIFSCSFPTVKCSYTAKYTRCVNVSLQPEINKKNVQSFIALLSHVYCVFLCLANKTTKKKAFTTDGGQVQRRRHHMLARGL